MAVDKESKLELPKSYFGEKTVVISKSGYGKSYACRVIIEEGVSKGHTFVVVDPQAAYGNLKDFDYINAAQVKSARQLGVLIAQTNKNVVISTKGLSIEDQNEFMFYFLQAYKKNIQKGIQTIVIDEIHKFAPEGEKTASKNLIRGLFQENRSDGLGCIAVTQRISRLDKTILSQSDHLLIGKVTSFRDKEAVKNYIDNPDDLSLISKLQKGDFYCYSEIVGEPQIIKVRSSSSEHTGNSPDNLLTQKSKEYHRHVNNIVNKQNMESKYVDKSEELVEKIVPSPKGFAKIAGLGVMVSLGSATAGIISGVVASRVNMNIGPVSSRTLSGLGSTIVLYSGYRMLKNKDVKEVLMYGAAGSAAFTLGSVVFDMANLAGWQMPDWGNYIVASATGALPMRSESNGGVDLNTTFA